MRRFAVSCVGLVSVIALACGGEEATSPPQAVAGAGAGAGTGGKAGAGAGGTAGGAGAAGANAGGTAGAGAGGTAGAGAGGTAGASGAGAGAGGTAGASGAGAGGTAGASGAGAGAGGTDGAGAGGAAGGGAGGEGGEAGAAGGPAAVCGNGVREATEACDGDDLGAATCASLGLGSLPRGPDRLPLASAGPGHPTCAPTCEIDKQLCEPPFQSIGYFLGPSAEGPHRYDFSENFGWDAAARVYRTTGISFAVSLPPGAAVPTGPSLLLTSSAGDTRTLLSGYFPPDYGSLAIAEPGMGVPFYEPCWDHDCETTPGVAPYPARAKRRVPMLLRHTEGTAHVPGGGKPWLAAKGKIRLVVGVVYADEPMPAASVESLFAPEGATAGTSLAAVPPWFAARAKEHALPSGMDVEVVWSGKQVKIPEAQIPASYDACISADWKPLLAPTVPLADNDVLVQIYWAKPGTPCASHVLRATQSFVLFARPDFFGPPGLVVSAAHELMHLFGASDKYTETALPGPDGKLHGCFFEGDASYDPHDIMCHRVVDVSPDGQETGFVNPPLPALGVWPLTAREVGWEDLDGDGTLEVDDACPWNEGC